MDWNFESNRVLLFLELLLLGGGRILRARVDLMVVLRGAKVVFFSRVFEEMTFLRLFFLSFFFGRLGGGVGINEPEPANFSSCS